MILENNYLQLSKIIFYHSPPQSTPATQILLFLKHAKQMFMLWPLPFVQNALPPTSPKSLFNVTLPMRPYLLIFYKSVIQPSLLFPIRLRLAPYYLSPTIFIYLLSVLHFPKTSVWEGRLSFIHSTVSPVPREVRCINRTLARCGGHCIRCSIYLFIFVFGALKALSNFILRTIL